MNTVSHKYRQSALLLLTAAIWGSAFVAQQTGMDYVGPFTFNAARNLLGGLTLLPLIVFFSSRKKRTLPPDASSEKWHTAKNALGGRYSLRHRTVCRLNSAADRHPVHNRRKGRFYHRTLHRTCSGLAVFFSESVYSQGLARSSYCRRWSLSALYDRRLLLFAEGRFSCACLRARIYRTYSGY